MEVELLPDPRISARILGERGETSGQKRPLRHRDRGCARHSRGSTNWDSREPFRPEYPGKSVFWIAVGVRVTQPLHSIPTTLINWLNLLLDMIVWIFLSLIVVIVGYCVFVSAS